MERRRFLRDAVAASLGLVPAAGTLGASTGSSRRTPSALNVSGPGMAHPGTAPRRTGPVSGRLPERWGVQLYTLRDLMAEDVPGTLAAVADLGYGEVEFAGYFGHAPDSLRRMLDDLGLQASSAHIPWEQLREDREAVFETAAAIGHRFLVVPWLGEEWRTLSGYDQLAWSLSSIGEDARQHGITIAYHNHDFEFERLPGADEPDSVQTGFEFLVRTADPGRVSFQLDLFWTVHAGHDPLDLFRTHPGRFTSVHVKDRTPRGAMVPVGQGAIDFATILPAAEAAGVEHMFVEHDNPADPLASVAASIRHLEMLRS